MFIIPTSKSGRWFQIFLIVNILGMIPIPKHSLDGLKVPARTLRGALHSP